MKRAEIGQIQTDQREREIHDIPWVTCGWTCNKLDTIDEGDGLIKDELQVPA